MYHDVQSKISKWARANPENLARVLQFCIISAHQRFYLVPTLIQEAEHPGSGALYGWKGQAYAEIWDKRAGILWNCEDIFNSGGRRVERADAMLAYLASFYGLGLTKAGFACQLAYGLSGCIDTVNTQRLNLPPRIHDNFARRKTLKARRRMAMRYNATVRSLGGTAKLWNDWCAAMVSRYPDHFRDANHVSQFHLTCLQLD